MRLGELLDMFVFNVCAGKANQTASAYRSKLRHLEKYLGEDRESFGQDDIDNFKIFLLERKTKRRGGIEVKGQLSKFTLRSVFATTHHFLKWAGEKGHLPSLELENIKEPAADPKPVTEMTVNALLASARQVGQEWEQARNTAIIYTLRDTGGRVGAIARIDIDNLDLAAGTAIAPDKNDQLSWLWFNAPTIQAISAWLDVRNQLLPKDQYLFTGARGHGLSCEGIRRVLSRLASAAGVTGRHNPHAFRHAFARDSILAGADLSQVSNMMGHKGIVVTYKYYSRWTHKEIKVAHRKYSPGAKLPEL